MIVRKCYAVALYHCSHGRNSEEWKGVRPVLVYLSRLLSPLRCAVREQRRVNTYESESGSVVNYKILIIAREKRPCDRAVPRNLIFGSAKQSNRRLSPERRRVDADEDSPMDEAQIRS